MITAHSLAPQGSVTHPSSYTVSDFPSSCAILCRNSQPLISFAFSLLRRRVACHVLGRDLAVGLEKLLDKVASPCGGKEPTLQRLAQYAEREGNSFRKKGKKQEAANIEDRCGCLRLFVTSCASLEDVRRTIQNMFKAGPGITLSTIHKSKGLEWETVFLLDVPTTIPSPYAEAQWEKIQEYNLGYVATTRAKLNLIFINSGEWKQ